MKRTEDRVNGVSDTFQWKVSAVNARSAGVAVQPAFYAVDLADVVLQMPHDGLLGGAMVSDLHQPDIERLFRDTGIVVDDLLQARPVGAVDVSCGHTVRRGDGQRAVLAVLG